jgi:hypothetical protein
LQAELLAQHRRCRAVERVGPADHHWTTTCSRSEDP